MKRVGRLKRLSRVLAFIAAAAVCCGGLGGCIVVTRGNGQNGIVIDGGNTDTNGEGSGSVQPVEYSAEAVNLGEQLLFGAITEAADRIQQNALSQTQKQELNDFIRGKIIPAFGARGVSEEDFRAALGILEERRAELLNIIEGVLREKALSAECYRSLKSIFGGFSALFGTELSARIGYDLSVCYYDYQIEKYTARYDKYGYTYYLGYIAEYTQNKADLKEEIGEENFVLLARLAYSGSDLVGALISGDVQGAITWNGAEYSDEELAAYFQSQAAWLNALNVSAKGWEYALKSAFSAVQSELASALLKQAEEGGDLSCFSRQINATVKILASALSRAGRAEAALFRGGNAEGFLCALAVGLEESDWQRLSDATGMIFPYGAAYRRVLSENGCLEQFDAYLASAERGTLDGVKAAARAGSGFYAALQAYLNDLTPVAAFLWYGI